MGILLVEVVLTGCKKVTYYSQDKHAHPQQGGSIKTMAKNSRTKVTITVAMPAMLPQWLRILEAANDSSNRASHSDHNRSGL